MERFTLVVETENKETVHKFEQMKDAKAFAQRAMKIKGNETSNISIRDNKVNQVVYFHYQKDGIAFHSNLI